MRHKTIIPALSACDQALENKVQVTEKATSQPVLDNVVACIEELLLIERRFTSYLGIDERVPATYLRPAQKELLKRLPRACKKHGNNIH